MNFNAPTYAQRLYELMLDQPLTGDIESVILGLTWTYCQSTEGAGLAMSPDRSTRTLAWPGTLAGRSVAEIASWITSWQPHEATIAMAAINSVINSDNALQASAVPLLPQGPANLAVFEYFLPRISGQRVVVIGRYPGLERYAEQCDMTVLEINPQAGDLPTAAAEFVLPGADWVFLTGTSIVNKTFPRLAELSANANLVLMGPTVPWLPELAEFGVDFIAGVNVMQSQLLSQTVAEGGGTRIFESGLQYAVADLGQTEMKWYETAIGDLVARRESLKRAMDSWYTDGNKLRFPKYNELDVIDKELSQLDIRYKRMWDARNSRPVALVNNG